MKRHVHLLKPLAVITIIALIVYSFVYFNSEKKALQITAIVDKVTRGGMDDIVISLNGARGVFFISRTEKDGLTASLLHEKLVNKEVMVSYKEPNGFLSLSPMTSTNQITELKLDGQVIFQQAR
jgi:hypothetical protein